MSKVKCSQCGYFNDKAAKVQCTRYSIPMNRDNMCVDCDEIDDMVEFQIAADASDVMKIISKYSLT